MADPTPATPVTTEATPAPKAVAPLVAAPIVIKPGVVTSPGQKVPSVKDRLAQAKADVAGETKPAATTDPGAPPTEAEKVVEAKAKRAAAGLAEVAEREAALIEQKRAVKVETDKIAAEREQYKPAIEAHKLAKQGKHLAALQALGIDMEAAQEEYLGTLREPTVEETIEKRVRAELDAADKRREDAAKVAAEERTKAEQAEYQSAANDWMSAAEAEFDANKADFDLIIAFDVGADQVLARALEERQKTGKTPSPLAALKLYEDELRARVGKSKKFRPADAGTEDKQATGADTTPRTLTGSSAGSVPITPAKAATGRPRSVKERLEEAKREVLGNR